MKDRTTKIPASLSTDGDFLQAKLRPNQRAIFIINNWPPSTRSAGNTTPLTLP